MGQWSRQGQGCAEAPHPPRSATVAAPSSLVGAWESGARGCRVGGPKHPHTEGVQHKQQIKTCWQVEGQREIVRERKVLSATEQGALHFDCVAGLACCPWGRIGVL